MKNIRFLHIGIVIIVLTLLLLIYLIFTGINQGVFSKSIFSETFILFIAVGFIAQLIDGTLGMAYGVSCTTFLLNMGVSLKVASSTVHTSEVFTTGVSALWNMKFKNINKPLFFKLLITGVIGSVLGAYAISEIFDGKMIKPYVSAYLLILGRN